jgi:hypothetical protein
MPRPISIALVLSVAIHVALFVLVDWLLSDEALPSISGSALLVSIAPLQADGDVADDKLVAPAAASESIITDENRQASRVSDRSPENIKTTEMVVAAEISPGELTPSSMVSSLESKVEIEAEVVVEREDSAVESKVATVVDDAVVAPSQVVTANPSSEPVVIAKASKIERSVRALTALSPKQEKMLNRKVRKWSENLHRMRDVASGLTWEYKGQEYQAKFTQLPSANDMGIQRVIVEISTEEDGERLSTEVHMKRLAFSNYGQFVNRWDPDVQIHNDEMDGRFHSNTEISLTYDRKVKPLFHGKVTTTSRKINVTNKRGLTRRDQIFVGGLQTGVRSIRLPKHFLPFPGDGEVADDQVHRFGEDTRISFFADGSFAWQAIDPESPQQVAAVSPHTTYIIANQKVTLYVKGTVNGKVLVYSPERIVIEDDLVYEKNPEEMPGADDYLGLVSDKYVDIAPPDITGPGDLLINAAIYAKRRFAVRGYRSRENALLYLYGSLSVGSLSATEPRYYTKIRFDQRLEEMRPPGFPMTDRYEVESWDTNWSVKPIG